MTMASNGRPASFIPAGSTRRSRSRSSTMSRSRARCSDDGSTSRARRPSPSRRSTGSLQVFSRQRDGQPGELCGTGFVAVETRNGKGKAQELAVEGRARAGELTGSGRDRLPADRTRSSRCSGSTLGAGERPRIDAAVAKSAPVELCSSQPEGGKGKRTLMSASPSFTFPTPVPGLDTAVRHPRQRRHQLQRRPRQMPQVVFAGCPSIRWRRSPNVTATLKDEYVVPTKFSLYGEFGLSSPPRSPAGSRALRASLKVGSEHVAGADAIAAFESKYDQGEFAFDGKAYLDAQLFKARARHQPHRPSTACCHTLGYRWRYPVAAVEKRSAPTSSSTSARSPTRPRRG